MYCKNGHENMEDSMYCEVCGVELTDKIKDKDKSYSRALIMVFMAIIFILMTCLVIIFGMFMLERDDDNSSEYAKQESVSSASSETGTSVPSSSKTKMETTKLAGVTKYNKLVEQMQVLCDASTVPLRREPNKNGNNIIDKIPNQQYVQVVGYDEQEDEVWFRVSYSDRLGWVRGGMLYSESMLNDTNLDLALKNKWADKFRLFDPGVTLDNKFATLKGALYFNPALSSGVVHLYSYEVTVEVLSKKTINGQTWYYVEASSGEYGWCAEGALIDFK